MTIHPGQQTAALFRRGIGASLAAAIEALDRGKGIDGEQFPAELQRDEKEIRRRVRPRPANLDERRCSWHTGRSCRQEPP